MWCRRIWSEVPERRNRYALKRKNEKECNATNKVEDGGVEDYEPIYALVCCEA